MKARTYVGRFAPTPSGPLHLGSLVAALGSWLCARAAQGRWLLRIDDLDTPRIAPGAEAAILRQLEAHGLHWDAAPRRQSEHLDAYAQALDHLRAQGLVYACRCTRARLRGLAPVADDGEAVYPGHCRDGDWPETDAALRLRTGRGSVAFDDPVLGQLHADLERDIGDFVVRRKDGQFAYQLACAVDEAAQGITEVVRGADLIGSTFRQIQLMRVLDLPVPGYRHLPLALGPDGRKLSKQNGAAALDTHAATTNLRRALALLGQASPPETATDTVHILDAALQHWAPARIPREPGIFT